MFGQLNAGITVHVFANREDELPPLEAKGDAIFLHDVEINEWKGSNTHFKC